MRRVARLAGVSGPVSRDGSARHRRGVGDPVRPAHCGGLRCRLVAAVDHTISAGRDCMRDHRRQSLEFCVYWFDHSRLVVGHVFRTEDYCDAGSAAEPGPVCVPGNRQGGYSAVDGAGMSEVSVVSRQWSVPKPQIRLRMHLSALRYASRVPELGARSAGTRLIRRRSWNLPAEVAGPDEVVPPGLRGHGAVSSLRHIVPAELQTIDAASSPFFFIHTLPTLARDLVFVLLGAVAALGLHRHREWGEGSGWPSSHARASVGFCRSRWPSHSSASSFAGATPPVLAEPMDNGCASLLMIIFLQRSAASFSCSTLDEETPRCCTTIPPSQRLAAPCRHHLRRMAMLETWVPSVAGASPIRSPARIGGKRESSSRVTVVAAAAAVWLWHPRYSSGANQGCPWAACCQPGDPVLGSASEQRQSTCIPVSGPLTREVVWALLRLQASLLPPLSLLIFVFRDLTENDMQLIATSRRRKQREE